MLDFLFVPMILFLVIVAPIWLGLHYSHKSKMAKGLGEYEQGNIDEMLESLDKLVERIETLESILDSDHPKWRDVKKRGVPNE